MLTMTRWLGVPHPMLSRLVNGAGTMTTNLVPGLMTRPVFANSRRGPVVKDV